MKRLITTLFIFAIAIGVLAPVTFSLTQNNSIAVQSSHVYAQDNSADESDKGVLTNIGSCGVVFGSMGNCLAYIFYFVPFYVGGVILNISARFLDFTATLTLSSKMFSSAGFLQVGWAMMRDIANMFFIFVLLYIALCMMFGIKKGGDPKGMIVSVVLIAIIINFSMFITDVVIDTSNTLALVFYNQITIKDSADKPITTPDSVTKALDDNVKLKSSDSSLVTIQPKQMGLALASAFHPQIFVKPGFWEGLKDPTGAGTSSEVPPSRMIVIVLFMGTIYFVVAWSFFVAAFSFMGRMVELFTLIIFSPIAFVSFVVPGLRRNKELGKFGWDSWWGALFKTAFAAPVYFLMILLITVILNAGLFSSSIAESTNFKEGSGWIIALVGSVLVPAVFLYMMLTKATDYAKKASGEFGEKLGNMASAAAKGAGAFAGGAVLGAAGGGMAAIGRNTLGRTSEKMLSGKFGQNLLKTSEGTGIKAWAARRTIEAGKAGTKASFDVRSTGGAKLLASKTGMKFESFGTLSTAAAKGGRESQRARQAAEEAKKIKLLENKDARKDIDKTIEQRNKDIAKSKDELHHDEEHLKDANTKHKNLKSVESDEKEKLTTLKKNMPDAEAKQFKQTTKDISDNKKNLETAEKEEKAASLLLDAAKAELAAATARGDSPAEIARLTADRDAKQSDLNNKTISSGLARQNVKDSEEKLAKDHPEVVAQQAKYDKAFNDRKGFEEDKHHGLKVLEEKTKDSRKKVNDMEHGKKSTVFNPASGEYEKRKRKINEKIPEMDTATGEQKRDPKTGEPQYHKNADGTFMTYQGAEVDDKGKPTGKTYTIEKTHALEDMGTHELSDAAANAEKSNFKSHMLNRMKGRYTDVKEERDALGNVTTMASSGKVKVRTTANRIKQTAQAATTSAAPAFIVGTAIAGPLGGLAAALTAMAVAGTLEAKQAGKRGEKVNRDTQHEAEVGLLKTVKDGKPAPTHKAVDTGVADTVNYFAGGAGGVLAEAAKGLGMKTGGGGHGGGDHGHGGGDHGGDHGGGDHGHAPAHGTDDHGHGGGDHGHGGGDHKGGH